MLENQSIENAARLHSDAVSETGEFLVQGDGVSASYDAGWLARRGSIWHTSECTPSLRSPEAKRNPLGGYLGGVDSSVSEMRDDSRDLRDGRFEILKSGHCQLQVASVQ